MVDSCYFRVSAGRAYHNKKLKLLLLSLIKENASYLHYGVSLFECDAEQIKFN